MDFSDEEREMLFSSTLKKFDGLIWSLRFKILYDCRRYWSILDRFFDCFNDNSFGPKDNKISDIEADIKETKEIFEQTKSKLTSLKNYYIPEKTEHSLAIDFYLLTAKRLIDKAEVEINFACEVISFIKKLAKEHNLDPESKDLTFSKMYKYIERDNIDKSFTNNPPFLRFVIPS